MNDLPPIFAIILEIAWFLLVEYIAISIVFS